jgi:transposase InsO family protein/predicted DNA-binding transcriptional regulator AlpA
MQSIEEFLNKSGISRATLFNHIKSGKLLSYKINGRTFIYTDEEIGITCPKLKSQIVKSKKAEWNQIITNYQLSMKSGAPVDPRQLINSILTDLKHWETKGISVTGFSEKSIYRKLKQDSLERKTRDDIGILRNSVLRSNSALNKLLGIAAYFYFKNSYPNVSITCDLVLKYSKENEEYWELAAIPKATMKRVLTKEFYERGYKEKHQMLNHFNKWKQSRAKVTGAFTDHIEFMDWIIGDDHKSDIDKVLNWNPLRNCYEKETVKGWHWIEGKTQKILSYTVKPGEINSEDLILSLMEALMSYGRPVKGILVDQGVAKSMRFQDFCAKAGIALKFSKPYEPTHKATIERSFRYVKEEHDAFLKNFVGGNHPEEGRHTSAKLSAEATDITFEEYRRSLDNYINDFYETRERNRTIDNKIIQISIRDLFNSYWRNFDKQDMDPRVLRYAYQFEEIRKYTCGMITFSRKNIRYNYMPAEALPPAFNNRKYRICCNPLDLSSIDVYSTCHIEDKSTGWVVDRNDLIGTFNNIRAMDPEKRQAEVLKFNRQADKYLKQYVKVAVDAAVVENDNADAVNAVVEQGGAIIDVRKQIEKTALNVIKTSMPVQRIKDIVTPDDGEAVTADKLTEEDWKGVEKIVR